MASFLDKFLDVEKTSKATITNPRKVFEDVLKQASGSAYTREIKYNIYYEIIAFYGVVDGIGTSTLVANVAQAIAELGLTVCVIDTSILSPVQDVLLNTNEAVLDDESTDVEHLDWFDMPFTKKSPLHVSKLNKNISVLSFKGKRRGVIDFLSTNDSDSLVEIAFTTLHNKFDIILIDCCHELSSINTACLQQAQQVIQVWNDAPVVVSNLESFITNAITLSCPLDKMRFVVANRLSKDVLNVMGTLDELCKQYRCKCIAKNYLSEELYLLAVTGKPLFRVESTDPSVIKYTESIIEVTCHILNIDLTGKKPKGTITSQEIMDGKVEGTYRKELKDFNDNFAQAHPEIQINNNPMNHDFSSGDMELDDGVDFDADFNEGNLDDSNQAYTMDSVMPTDVPEMSRAEQEQIVKQNMYRPSSNTEFVPSDINRNPETNPKKRSLFGKKNK